MTTTETTFRAAGIQVIGERLRKMLALADPVRAAEDVEAVHDMRVASRRLRAALAVFADVFAGPAFEQFAADVRRVTRALGAARDLDVIVERAEALAAELPEHERGALRHFADRRRCQRLRLQKGVRKALDRLDRRDLAGQFEAIVAALGAEGAAGGSVDGAPAAGRLRLGDAHLPSQDADRA